MKFNNPYWDIKTKIELLSKWIIVHSMIYYRLGTSLVTDKKFDANSKQLVDLIKAHHHSFRASRWYYVLYDFDGTTGFDIPSRLSTKDFNEMEQIALHLIKMHKEV